MNPLLQPFLPDNSSFRIVVVTTPDLNFGWINSHRKQLMRLLAEPLLAHSWFSTARPTQPGQIWKHVWSTMPVISIDNIHHCMFYKLKINNSKDCRKTIYAVAVEQSRRNNGLRLMILIFAGWPWYWSSQEFQRREVQLSKFFPQSLVKRRHYGVFLMKIGWFLWLN